jgi:hypothetical protein
VLVSTVHRAQGSERHTVFFDPVAGEHDFLLTDDAKRLVNVAMSRAKPRLVLLLSPIDRANPLLNQIAEILEQTVPAPTEPKTQAIADFASRPDYPACLVNQVVRHRFVTGKVAKVAGNGRYAVVIEVGTRLRVRVELAAAHIKEVADKSESITVSEPNRYPVRAGVVETSEV